MEKLGGAVLKNIYRTIISMVVFIVSLQFIFAESLTPTSDGFTLEVSGVSVVDFNNYINSGDGDDCWLSAKQNITTPLII